MARKEKQPIHKVVMTEEKREIIRQLLNEYDIETAEDIQDQDDRMPYRVTHRVTNV